MDLIVAGVVIVYGQLVEVPGNVVGGTRIHVPIVVDAGGGGKCGSALIRSIIFVAVPADFGGVANLAANLALGACRIAGGATAGPVGVGEAAMVVATAAMSTVVAMPRTGATTAMIPASTGSSHGRGVTSSSGAPLKMCVLLKAQELDVEVTWSDWISTSDNRGEHRVVILIEAGKEI
jgi:hypothetical protein